MNLVRPIEVVPGIHQLRAIGARVTAILGQDGIVLVDAGGRGSLGLIAAGLQALGASVDQVKLIVLTHYHPDHSGGLRRLAEATRAKVAVHRHEERIISGTGPCPNPFHNRLLAWVTSPFIHLLYDHRARVEFLLDDGDALPLADGVQVIHTPGHTSGSICLYLAPQKLLIVGDALQHRSGRLSPPAFSVTHDSRQARESLEKLLAVDFETICFSHFPVLRRDARKALLQLVQKAAH